jgi:hypothetical protein
MIRKHIAHLIGQEGLVAGEETEKLIGCEVLKFSQAGFTQCSTFCIHR